MFSLLKRRAVLIGLGLVLLSLVIWLVGPYIGFQFGSTGIRPLESAIARIVAILLLVAVWAVSAIVARLRAAKASDKLMAGVMRPSTPEAGRPSADAVQLRERFEEAVAALRKRKDIRSLYELPWYVFIGAPGSGKTTALVNSGLKFPLEQRSGRGALRGVGGTRNCDWWFTDEAVFLDTAGRFTTQDSDAAGDSAGWNEFLTLLCTYRKRRPINGIILTISAQDLMTLGHAEREAHVAAVRRRLDELNRQLRMQLPVYVMVTKCDLMAGFSEYFDDLSREGRAQVWGMTFPYEETLSGEAAAAVPVEFDSLVARLNEQVLGRLETERDSRRRAKIFGFPQQFAAVRQSLTEFVAEVFGSSRFDRQVLLRGVYFTSGTQEGTPIDRLLGAIGRRLQVAPDIVAPSSGRGKSYFLESTLKDVILNESGIAGINKRFEVRTAALQLGAYIATGLAVILGVVALSVSYRRNLAYLADVDAAVSKLEAAPARTTSIGAVLPRLDDVAAVEGVANRYRDHAPWGMRWGLFQGRSVGNATWDAYEKALSDLLLPNVALQFKERMRAAGTGPEELFEYLKGYRMLGEPEHLDKAFLGALADRHWKATYESQPRVAAALSSHFHRLLEGEEPFRAVELDKALVTEAQNTIRNTATIPALVYQQLRQNYGVGGAADLRLDTAAGMNAERVLRRRSGKNLSEPVPALFTAGGFADVTGKAGADLVERVARDTWVWGDAPDLSGSLLDEVIARYENDYIAFWDGILQDVEVTPFASTADGLAMLAGQGSPLRGFLQTVDKQTYLVKPPPPAQSGGLLASAAARVGQVGQKVESAFGGKAAAAPTATPGARVTAHFDPIHKLVAGAGAPQLDQLFAQIEQLKAQRLKIDSSPGQASSLDDLNQAARLLLQQASQVPPAVGGIFQQVGKLTSGAAVSGVAGDLAGRYREQVLNECNTAIRGRYPFAASSKDVAPGDFGRVFGYNGLYDAFFAANLQSAVDTSSWRWRSNAGIASSIPLKPFEQARLLRDLFFQPGSQEPQLRFTITPGSLDRSVGTLRLELDAQTILDYRHGPPTPVTVTWPGKPPGMAAVTFQMLNGQSPNKTFDNFWAWFRLIDAVQTHPEDDVRVRLSLELGGAVGTVIIGSNTVKNPYAHPEWRQFSCGS